MSKVHEDNAGYVGVSHEETQDPFHTYSRLAFSLAQSSKTANTTTTTETVTASGGAYYLNNNIRADSSVPKGSVTVFDQSSSSNSGHLLAFSRTPDGIHGSESDNILYGYDESTNVFDNLARIRTFDSLGLSFANWKDHAGSDYAKELNNGGTYGTNGAHIFKVKGEYPVQWRVQGSFNRYVYTSDDGVNWIKPRANYQLRSSYSDYKVVSRYIAIAAGANVNVVTVTASGIPYYKTLNAPAPGAATYAFRSWSPAEAGDLPPVWTDMTDVESSTAVGTNHGTGVSTTAVAYYVAGARWKTLQFTAHDLNQELLYWTSDNGVDWFFGGYIDFTDIYQGHITYGQYVAYAFQNNSSTWSSGSYQIHESFGIAPGTSGSQVTLGGAHEEESLYYYCTAHSGMGSKVSVVGDEVHFTGALPIVKSEDGFGGVPEYDLGGNDIGVFFSSAPAAGNAASVLSTSPGSSNVWLNTAGKASIKVIFSTPQTNVSRIVYSGGGYSVGESYDIYVNDVLVGANRTTVSSWGLTHIDITATTVRSFEIIGASGYSLTNLKLGDSTLQSTPSGTIGEAKYAVNPDPFAQYCVVACPGDDMRDYSGTIRGNGSSGNKTISTVHSGNDVDLELVGKLHGRSRNFQGAQGVYVGDGETDLDLGSEDYTLECWFRPTTHNTWNTIFHNYGTDYSIFFATNSSGQPHLYYYTADSNFSDSNFLWGGTCELSTWTHVAYSRKGDKFLCFLNGKLVTTHTLPRRWNHKHGSAYWCFGGGWNYSSGTSYGHSGQIQDVRLYKGVAKYDRDFIVPDKFDIEDRSARKLKGVSSDAPIFNTSVKKFYGGGAEFDGADTQITIGYDDALKVGQNDFTYELWVNVDSDETNVANSSNYWNSIVALCGDGNATNSPGLYIASSSSPSGLTGTVVAILQTNSARLDANQDIRGQGWVHVALERYNGTTTIYLNGTPKNSVADTYDYDSTRPTRIGKYIGVITDVSDSGFDGYLQDFRLYIGIGKYRGASFTPPKRSLQGTARRYPSGIYVVS